ncbi:putative integral membrane protein [Brugia pahangi]
MDSYCFRFFAHCSFFSFYGIHCTFSTWYHNEAQDGVITYWGSTLCALSFAYTFDYLIHLYFLFAQMVLV